MSETIILRGDPQRTLAKRLIEDAPAGHVMTIRKPKRTDAQNDRMWAMLGDISKAKPMGRKHTADVWKMILMNACGHECQFEIGLDGRAFPVGFRSSHLDKDQMSDLIEYMFWFGAQHNVRWSEPHPDERSVA